jgi:hypothetical protein
MKQSELLSYFTHHSHCNGRVCRQKKHAWVNATGRPTFLHYTLRGARLSRLSIPTAPLPVCPHI